MNILKLTLITILLSFTFNGCVSKSQTDVTDSNTEDISTLLKTLIKKEKEINELNKQLEDCKNSKK